MASIRAPWVGVPPAARCTRSAGRRTAGERSGRAGSVDAGAGTSLRSNRSSPPGAGRARDPYRSRPVPDRPRPVWSPLADDAYCLRLGTVCSWVRPDVDHRPTARCRLRGRVPVHGRRPPVEHGEIGSPEGPPRSRDSRRRPGPMRTSLLPDDRGPTARRYGGTTAGRNRRPPEGSRPGARRRLPDWSRALDGHLRRVASDPATACNAALHASVLSTNVWQRALPDRSRTALPDRTRTPTNGSSNTPRRSRRPSATGRTRGIPDGSSNTLRPSDRASADSPDRGPTRPSVGS